jgi:hypothetical protein
MKVSHIALVDQQMEAGAGASHWRRQPAIQKIVEN